MTDAMTFDAEHSGIATDKKESIGRSMGNMADRTPFHFSSEMFVDPRAPLFRMTFETDIRPRGVCTSKACTGPFSMGRMAIRTRHGPFQNLVAGGQAELSLHLRVATKTEIRFFGLQKPRGGWGFMDLMAIITAHGRKLVGPPSGFEKTFLPTMAFQTGL